MVARKTFSILWALPLATAITLPASAQHRQLAGTEKPYELFQVLPGTTTYAGTEAEMPVALEGCSTTSFVPTDRPYNAAPSQPPRTTEPFSFPSCRFRRNIVGPYGILLGRVRSRSINDLGTYTITCPRNAPASIACESISSPNACGRRELCLPTYYGRENFFSLTIEIYNEPPTGRLNFTSPNALPDGTLPFNGTAEITADVSDPDPGGSPTVSWRTIPPRPGAAGERTTSAERAFTLQFVDETDFGTWQVEAMIDDNEGERVTRRLSIDVVNQPPMPVISGTERVVIGEPIVLSVSPDEDGGDYRSTRWEYYPPGGPTWGVLDTETENATTVTVPTEISGIGPWQFRVTVTDNDPPTPLTGTSMDHSVEVYNPPPTVDAIATAERIRAEDGTMSLTATGTDPDGGDVELTVRAFQVPDDSAVEPGDILATGMNSVSFSRTASEGDPGTWILEVIGKDDEPAAIREEDSKRVRILVDAAPHAVFTPPERLRVGSITGMVSLSAADSIDPDSPCDPPDYCHSTVDDTAVTGITEGIVRYDWTLIDVALDDGSYHPRNDVRELFDLSFPPTQSTLDIPIEKLKPGLFTFQVDVVDAEGRHGSAYKKVEVIEENTKPIAFVSPPSRHIVSVLGVAQSDITVSGLHSFDPDNILTGDLPGIDSFLWTKAAGPDGCVNPTGSQDFTLYFHDERVPTGCLDVYEFKLTVEDDDEPIPHKADAFTTVVIGTCPGAVCIDLPTTELPQRVEFADETDILILYHIDPSAARAFPFGMIARLDIFHDSDPLTPIFTSYSPNVSTGPLTPLLVFHWNGFWFAERPRPGRYDVQISLLNDVLAPAGTGLADRQNEAIFIEVDELEIPDDAPKYVNRDTLGEPTGRITIPYEIIGAIVPDNVEWRLVRTSDGREIHDGDLPGALTGTLDWDGKISHSSYLDAGEYVIEFEAFKGARSLTGTVRHPLTVYQLTLQPSSGTNEISAMVNSDDDNFNDAPDLTDSFAAEDDLIKFTVKLEPPTLKGRAELTSVDSVPSFRLWNSNRKVTETVLGTIFEIPGNVPPESVAYEAVKPGIADFRLNFTTDDGVVLKPKIVEVTNVELQVLTDTDYDNSLEPAQFVRIGLWDQAFRLPGAAGGPTGSLYNNVSETQNFVGRDTRRFYYQVTDPSANADENMVETVSGGVFEWYTIDQTGAAVDYPPTRTARSLTLTETGPDTGIFVSRAVMLVSDTADRDQPTHTGLPGGGLAAYGDPDHRTRLAILNGASRVQYRPAIASPPILYLTTAVMQRNPEERRSITVRIFNFSDSSNHVAATPLSTINTAIDEIRARYAVAGIRVNAIYNPSTDLIDIGPMSGVDLESVGTFSFSGNWQTLTPSADQTFLINLARTVDPATPTNADTLYVMFVPRLAGNRGESFPDTYIAGGGAASAVARNFVFISGTTASPYTPPHELGHMLIPPQTSAQANGTAAGWDLGGHYGGPQSANNLMRRGTVFSSSLTDTRRLWDDTAIHQVRQILLLRGSRFVN